MKYLFDEVSGKFQGEMIIVEAETPEEACEKAGMTEIIKPHEKFKEMYFGKIYSCTLWGEPWDKLYICHK